MGRPADREQRRRAAVFVQELARSGSFRKAVEVSRIRPARALALLDSDGQAAAVAAAVLADRVRAA